MGEIYIGPRIIMGTQIRTPYYREFRPIPIWRFPKIRGTFLVGAHNKDCSIWGSILGSPCLGTLPFRQGRVRTNNIYIYIYISGLRFQGIGLGVRIYDFGIGV